MAFPVVRRRASSSAQISPVPASKSRAYRAPYPPSAFQGTSLTYAFAWAPNRRLAGVIIDNLAPRTIDIYSPAVSWQSRETFCCFAPAPIAP